ncbi:serine/arginine repetitive matrix protein 1-like [Paramacrobiotus metropolitanus]|uniref:serine/arginine repetitive matrix protein 1-like n=1 Tax=Paramacrobiotus metropolitanus TaxID=2943436 RepID=UPI0024463CB6|nr:serine/arginine repetitive matrix protein 1-like [Paramacrobiotus metropolitanus]
MGRPRRNPHHSPLILPRRLRPRPPAPSSRFRERPSPPPNRPRQRPPRAATVLPPRAPTSPPPPPPPPAAVPQYEVERIINDRRLTGGDPFAGEFKVHWKGYPPSEDSWEPLASLLQGEYHCKDAVMEYLAQRYKGRKVLMLEKEDDGRVRYFILRKEQQLRLVGKNGEKEPVTVPTASGSKKTVKTASKKRSSRVSPVTTPAVSGSKKTARSPRKKSRSASRVSSATTPASGAKKTAGTPRKTGGSAGRVATLRSSERLREQRCQRRGLRSNRPAPAARLRSATRKQPPRSPTKQPTGSRPHPAKQPSPVSSGSSSVQIIDEVFAGPSQPAASQPVIRPAVSAPVRRFSPEIRCTVSVARSEASGGSADDEASSHSDLAYSESGDEADGAGKSPFAITDHVEPRLGADAHSPSRWLFTVVARPPAPRQAALRRKYSWCEAHLPDVLASYLRFVLHGEKQRRRQMLRQEEEERAKRARLHNDIQLLAEFASVPAGHRMLRELDAKEKREGVMTADFSAYRQRIDAIMRQPQQQPPPPAKRPLEQPQKPAAKKRKR